MIPSIANIRKAIYCLNKRIDLLEGGNYLDTIVELSNKISVLESLISEDLLDPTSAIDKFNEIVAFLETIENTDTLSGLLLDIISLIPDALIQSDWNQTNNKSVDFIKNKPTIPAAQILSDWNQSDNSQLDFIKNKPSIIERSEMGEANGVATLDEDGHLEAEQLEGDYPNSVSGNVVGEFSDSSEVSFRPTAGAVDVNSGKAGKGAKLMSVKGNTIAWNQLLQQGKLVDMGLPSGTLWASCNIDVTQPNGFAASPFQYECSFFSWGNVDGHNPISNSAFDYNWGGVNQSAPYYEGQVYGETQGNTLTGNIPVGDTYDAARINVGSLWRMPTTAEFKELFDNCDFVKADGTTVIAAGTTDKRVTVNGVLGIYLKSKINGNLLFFACSGYGSGTSWNNRGSYGCYWSASFYSARNAYYLYFFSGGVSPQYDYNRFGGFAVRPVISKSALIGDGKNGHKYALSSNNANITDVTLTYGFNNEPSTVAQFESDYERWFGKPLTYEEYDDGSLRPVLMQSVKTTGFNQWNEEYIKGSYDGTTGLYVSYTDRLCTKNKIHVLPSTKYYFKTRTGLAGNVLYYRKDGSFICANNDRGNSIFTTPDDCYFINVSFGRSYGSTYNHDICINLSHSGARNGEYEPYWTSMLNVPVTTLKGKLNGEGSSVVVFPGGMKKAGTVYDEIVRRGDKTYAIKRVGSVDLGSLTYNHAWYGSNTFSTTIVETKTLQRVARFINPKYSFVEYASRNYYDKIITSNDGGIIIIKDSTYSNAATFKVAMSGVMLYYELATPEEYLLDDFELPQDYDVDDYGTEEVQLGTNGCAPILDLKYGINAGDTIKNLPHNYVSAVGEQSFTEAQKARARKNIGTVSEEELESKGFAKIWRGTLAEYDLILTPDDNTIYIITPDLP